MRVSSATRASLLLSLVELAGLSSLMFRPARRRPGRAMYVTAVTGLGAAPEHAAARGTGHHGSCPAGAGHVRAIADG